MITRVPNKSAIACHTLCRLVYLIINSHHNNYRQYKIPSPCAWAPASSLQRLNRLAANRRRGHRTSDLEITGILIELFTALYKLLTKNYNKIKFKMIRSIIIK